VVGFYRLELHPETEDAVCNPVAHAAGFLRARKARERRESVTRDEIKRTLEEVDVGERIFAWRLAEGWGQQQCAKELGITSNYLSALETDKAPLSARLARKMAFVFGCSTEEFLLGALPTRRSSRQREEAVA